MSKSILLFGIHMHQPVDNFEWVIKHGVEVCYGPFFDIVSQYPSFRFSVHCSGWLMEQIQKNHPKLYKKITTLAEQGSIEFFSAGYYEPILSAIPAQDREAQINILNSSISSSFNQTPKGLWLTERVWESSLIPQLKKTGIKYTVMDDYHFQCAGFNEEKLDSYFMTEEGGEELALFPISKKLRYAIPFLTVEKAIEAIKSYNKREDSAAIIFDDAEKFGMWPGTHEWVYTKGWLEKFIQKVLSDESIETMHYGQYYKNYKGRGLAYLPNVSYYEMGEWSLYADDALKLEEFKQEMGEKRYEKEGVKFLKGGIWKNFFLKYTESNRIHKRMLELSKVRATINSSEFDTSIYKLQTNDTFWHGVFGGLYLPNLRDNAYSYLIACENVRYGKKSLVTSECNELDGHEKIKVITPRNIFRFDSANGGQLIEFDSRKNRFNWQNTLTRRKEAYHQRVLQTQKTEQTPPAEEGIDTIHNSAVEIDDKLRDAIVYDWYTKNSFIDHVSDETFSCENFRHCNFREYGDFANQPFEVTYNQQKACFTRDGGLYFPQKEAAYLKKEYYFNSKGFNFEIQLSTQSDKTLTYILEHNFHFSNYDVVTINGTCLLEDGKLNQVKKIELYDANLKQKIIITLTQASDIYYFLLKTLSQSEQGFDLTIQGLSMAILMPFSKELAFSGSLEVVNV